MADGNLDRPIAEIMEWPGRDNSRMPSTAFGLDLAPCIDVNSDGVYQPELGDYPDFRADVSFWWVTNDNVSHLESGAAIPLGAEVQVLAQAYEATGHPSSKAQLYSIKVINKFEPPYDSPLDSLSHSIWVDPFVCFDDRTELGSIPSRNAMFSYNNPRAGVDSSQLEHCRKSTADNSPICFLQSLGSTLIDDPVLVRNSGISERPRNRNTSIGTNGDPLGPTRGRWVDGTPITVGDDGSTNWIYSGNPADSAAWSSCRQDSLWNSPFLLNVTMKEKFNLGDEFKTDNAVFVADYDVATCPDIDALLPTIDSIGDYFQNTVVSSHRTSHTSFNELSLKPNPTDDAF